MVSHYSIDNLTKWPAESPYGFIGINLFLVTFYLWLPPFLLEAFALRLGIQSELYPDSAPLIFVLRISAKARKSAIRGGYRR